VTTLNAAIRDRRLARCEKDGERSGEPAGDRGREPITRAGERIGVGDRVATRRNDRDLGVANRDTWTVTGLRGDGTLTVRGRNSERTLPAAYVRAHVELAYATTVYGAQGDTVDRAHFVVGETTGAAAAYVAMTRFGSKLSPPSCLAGSGIALTDLASMGCTGGITGRRMSGSVAAARTPISYPGAVPIRLCARDPRVSKDRLLGELVPPPRFATVSFDSYEPDPDQPSQQRAVEVLREFAEQLNRPLPRRRGLFRKTTAPSVPGGVYLDGGYGVGKTHLLASLWHAVPGPKLFATFVELTHLVGALGFHEAVAALSSYRLVCVDEFELDDPGDTVLVSTLLRRLREEGVRLAATSNTLPGRLGEGRFATTDFLREIQGLAEAFASVRIEGEDYRHRGLPKAPAASPPEEVRRRAEEEGASLDHFVDLFRHLARVHPSKYGALLDGVRLVCLEDVRTVEDQAVALRLVVLADRMYDRDLPLVGSGVSMDELFAPELLAGGYRKKYFRAISRLDALARDGAGLSD
jgi:cell division protein ZapE